MTLEKLRANLFRLLAELEESRDFTMNIDASMAYGEAIEGILKAMRDKENKGNE